MNIEELELFGLGAFESILGLGEHGLVRVPALIRNQLNETARFIGMDSVGIEIRFVTDAPNIDLHLSALKPEYRPRGKVRIYKGDFLLEELEVEAGSQKFHRIISPEIFGQVKKKFFDKCAYAPSVWRIVFDSGVYVLEGINTHGHMTRKAKDSELPALKWLAYGSSITNSDLDGYPHIAASKLGVQIQNMGFSGSCHIEKVLVDYMLDACDFDFITCELGVNMRYEYTVEAFEERASYLIERLVSMGKPSLIITTFPNCCTEAYTQTPDDVTLKEKQFNEILIRLVDNAKCPTLQLMHGYEVLTNINCLSADLLHPTKYGHAVMGMNLADRLIDYIGIGR